MNKFFVLLVALFIQTAAFAQNAPLAQCNFLTQYSAQGLTDCNSNTDHGLKFATGTSQANIDAVTTAAASYDWTGASVKVPNVSQMEIDLWNDSNVKPVIGNLIIFYPLLEKNLGPSASAQDNLMCQEFWIGMKASSPAWLTSAVISAIESHAAADNVALVAPAQ